MPEVHSVPDERDLNKLAKSADKGLSPWKKIVAATLFLTGCAVTPDRNPGDLERQPYSPPETADPSDPSDTRINSGAVLSDIEAVIAGESAPKVTIISSASKEGAAVVAPSLVNAPG